MSLVQLEVAFQDTNVLIRMFFWPNLYMVLLCAGNSVCLFIQQSYNESLRVTF